jgi:two-component system phosphate regulon sensor histidine kinase PhoR
MTRWSFFSQALAGNLIAVLIAVSVGIFVSQRNVEKEFARILAEETHHLAGGIALLMEGNTPSPSFYTLAEQVDRRITVVALDGRVLADSAIRSEEVRDVENHLSRPEVQQALNDKGWGWTTRRSATTSENYLYVALHVAPHDRIIRVAVPLTDYHKAVGAINFGIVAGVFVGGFLAILAAMAVAGRLQKQLRMLIEVARKRSAGEKAAFPESGNEDFHSLTSALIEMTNQLDNRLFELENERTRLRAILDNMIEGVILCNEHGAILLWNEAFLELFACEDIPAGKKLIELTRVPEVVKLSETALYEKAPQLLEFEFNDREIQARKRGT